MKKSKNVEKHISKKILFILSTLTLLIVMFTNVYAKYVVSKSISINFSTACFYFDVTADITQTSTLPVTVNFTVKNHNGKNFTDLDIDYEISIQNSDDYTMTVNGGNARTIKGRSKVDDTFQVSIDKKGTSATKDIIITFDTKTPYITKKTYTIEIVDSDAPQDVVWKNKTDKNRTVDGKQGTYKNPTIPVGFGALNTDTAKWNTSGGEQTDWNNGLVIVSNEAPYNEFVWVPVDNDIVEYKYYYHNNIDIEIGNIRELEQIAGGYDAEENVRDFGGFYIGRYEAGLPTELEEAESNEKNLNVQGKPVSLLGAKPWNHIQPEQAMSNALSMYSNSHCKSAMINCLQFDTTAYWIESKGEFGDSSVTEFSDCANLYDNELELTLGPVQPFIQKYGTGQWMPGYGSVPFGPHLMTCGASELTKKSNIYDLIGNVQEYCTTYIQDDSWGNVFAMRGGDFQTSGNRLLIDWCKDPTVYATPITGFRVTLLLTENG